MFKILLWMYLGATLSMFFWSLDEDVNETTLPAVLFLGPFKTLKRSCIKGIIFPFVAFLSFISFLSFLISHRKNQRMERIYFRHRRRSA